METKKSPLPGTGNSATNWIGGLEVHRGERELVKMIAYKQLACISVY